jgi:hypothetical protein
LLYAFVFVTQSCKNKLSEIKKNFQFIKKNSPIPIIIYCFSFDLQRYELLMKQQKDLREKDGTIDGNGAFMLKLIKIATKIRTILII